MKISLDNVEREFIKLKLTDPVYEGPRSIQKFVFNRLTGEVQKDKIEIEVFFSRDLTGFFLTTLLPSLLANLIGHMSNFFDDSFEASIGVNLTLMLVLTTMMIEISNQFDKISGVMMIQIWIIFSLSMPFLEVTFQTWIRDVKRRKRELIQEDVHSAEKVDQAWVNKKRIRTIEKLAILDREIQILNYVLLKIKPLVYVISLISFLAVGFIHRTTTSMI